MNPSTRGLRSWDEKRPLQETGETIRSPVCFLALFLAPAEAKPRALGPGLGLLWAAQVPRDLTTSLGKGIWV